MLYRFRSIDHLLGEHKELKNQEIYFASQQELNDPLEGMLKIIWDGDKIAWEGLFINYLLCFECTFTKYRLGASIEELRDIPVFSTDKKLPTQEYHNFFNAVRKTLFEKDFVINFMEVYGNKYIIYSKEMLLFFFRLMHLAMVDIILEVSHNYRLLTDEEKENIKISGLSNEQINKCISAITQAKEGKDELKDYFESMNCFYNQFTFEKHYYMKFDEVQNKWLYLLIEFTEDYINKLSNLVFPDCYIACFTSDYTNSAMWGNYAQGHKGVCLIFNSERADECDRLTLYLPKSFDSNGISYEFTDVEFKKVTYNTKINDINFFDSLGRLNKDQLQSWLINKNGEKSKNYIQMHNDIQKWRDKYWSDFVKTNCNKTRDWEFESEYRLYILDHFFELNDPKNRVIKYKFEDLDGIIFGIKTPDKEKAEIISIITEKCKEVGRKDFNFYQAMYDNKTDKIKTIKLKYSTIK